MFNSNFYYYMLHIRYLICYLKEVSIQIRIETSFSFCLNTDANMDVDIDMNPTLALAGNR